MYAVCVARNESNWRLSALNAADAASYNPQLVGRGGVERGVMMSSVISQHNNPDDVSSRSPRQTGQGGGGWKGGVCCEEAGGDK
ncbi:Membrane-bound lytic murein transglycosylase F, partial [Clarias magur]